MIIQKFWALAKDQSWTPQICQLTVFFEVNSCCGLIPSTYMNRYMRGSICKPTWTSENIVKPTLIVSAVTVTCPVQVCKTLLETDQSTIYSEEQRSS